MSTKLGAVDQKMGQLFALNMDPLNQIMAYCGSLIQKGIINVETKRKDEEIKLEFTNQFTGRHTLTPKYMLRFWTGMIKNKKS